MKGHGQALGPDKLEQTDIIGMDIFVENEGYGMHEFSNFKENDHHVCGHTICLRSWKAYCSYNSKNTPDFQKVTYKKIDQCSTF